VTEYPDSKPGDEYVWLGSLAGFEVISGPMDWDPPGLRHRCGWSVDLDGPDAILGNLIEIALGHRARSCAADTP
jgi:hypothetical protein